MTLRAVAGGTASGGPGNFSTLTVTNLPSYQVVYPDVNQQLSSDVGFTRTYNTSTGAATANGLLIRSVLSQGGVVSGYSGVTVDVTNTGGGFGNLYLQTWNFNGAMLATMLFNGNFATFSTITAGTLTNGTSTLNSGGSISVAATNLSANTTIGIGAGNVFVDASGGARVITLPAASGCTGRIYTVKKIDSSANTVTIQGNAAELIDGTNTKVISTQYTALIIQSNGTVWYILSTS